MGRATLDGNFRQTTTGVDHVSFITPTEVAVNTSSHEMLVQGTITSSVLPTGAATSDNQTNGNQIVKANLLVSSAAVTTSNPVPIMPPLVGYLDTLETALASMGSFLTTVTTAGTRVQLATNTCKSLTIKAKSTNTGLIYVGNVAVASTNGFQLLAGESVSLDISNTNLVYIDSSVNGEGISTIFAN